MRTSKYSSLMTPAALGRLTDARWLPRHQTRLGDAVRTTEGVDAEPLLDDVVDLGRQRRRPHEPQDLLASGAPERGISGRSKSCASRYAIVPSVDVMVAPVRFISGQKFDTEKRR